MFFVSSCIADEENKETTASFSSHIGSIEEVGEDLKCLLVLEPLQGTFKENVNNNEIYFESDFKDATNVEIVTSTTTKIELYFTIPCDVENAIEFVAEGTVKLGNGVLLDMEGKEVGEFATLQTYKHPLANLQAGSIYASERFTIKLNHKGAYVAKFYITWTEITDWSDFKAPYDRIEMLEEFLELDINEKLKYAKPCIENKSWYGNGDGKTAGFKEEINLTNLNGNGYYNLRVRAEVKTGLLWDPWHVICDDYATKNTIYFTVGGTTLNTNYDFDEVENSFNLSYTDEIINLLEFKSELTEEGKVLCSAVLGLKNDRYSYTGDVSIKLSGVIDELFIVNVGKKSETVAFQFEVESEKWDENGNVLNIVVNEGLSESLNMAYRNLTVVVK